MPRRQRCSTDRRANRGSWVSALNSAIKPGDWHIKLTTAVGPPAVFLENPCAAPSPGVLFHQVAQFFRGIAGAFSRRFAHQTLAPENRQPCGPWQAECRKPVTGTKWKPVCRIANMVMLLPFGAYPSGAYMRNPGSYKAVSQSHYRTNEIGMQTKFQRNTGHSYEYTETPS
jgi:hypothetical protein